MEQKLIQNSQGSDLALLFFFFVFFFSVGALVTVLVVVIKLNLPKDRSSGRSVWENHERLLSFLDRVWRIAFLSTSFQTRMYMAEHGRSRSNLEIYTRLSSYSMYVLEQRPVSFPCQQQMSKNLGSAALMHI